MISAEAARDIASYVESRSETYLYHWKQLSDLIGQRSKEGDMFLDYIPDPHWSEVMKATITVGLRELGYHVKEIDGGIQVAWYLEHHKEPRFSNLVLGGMATILAINVATIIYYLGYN